MPVGDLALTWYAAPAWSLPTAPDAGAGGRLRQPLRAAHAGPRDPGRARDPGRHRRRGDAARRRPGRRRGRARGRADGHARPDPRGAGAASDLPTPEPLQLFVCARQGLPAQVTDLVAAADRGGRGLRRVGAGPPGPGRPDRGHGRPRQVRLHRRADGLRPADGRAERRGDHHRDERPVRLRRGGGRADDVLAPGRADLDAGRVHRRRTHRAGRLLRRPGGPHHARPRLPRPDRDPGRGAGRGGARGGRAGLRRGRRERHRGRGRDVRLRGGARAGLGRARGRPGARSWPPTAAVLPVVGDRTSRRSR